jgi:hypothetical protein
MDRYSSVPPSHDRETLTAITTFCRAGMIYPVCRNVFGAVTTDPLAKLRLLRTPGVKGFRDADGRPSFLFRGEHFCNVRHALNRVPDRRRRSSPGASDCDRRPGRP